MTSDMKHQIGNKYRSPWGFAQLLEKIDIGILVLDHGRGEIDYCNAALFDVLGDEHLCRDYQLLYDLFVHACEDKVNPDPTGRSSHQVVYQGRLFGFSVYRTAVDFCCVFIRDITEKSRMESIAQAVNAMDNIGFIFSGIRHEIGNPLNSLKMALSVLRQDCLNISPERLEKYLDRGMADIARVEYLLKSLKTFSMYESVELSLYPLAEFLNRFISLVEEDFYSHGIRIRTDISPDLGSTMLDERAMHQVLLNIFNNAADALRGRHAPEIRIQSNNCGELLCLDISDNGCGIGEEQLKHIFQPFNTSKPNGNGLGLVITRKLLALMNSDIEIARNHDSGTRISIRMPRLEPVSAGAAGK